MKIVLGTYWEMPGLCLTVAQGARLFGISIRTCDVLFEDLVRDGFLIRSADGSYRLPRG